MSEAELKPNEIILGERNYEAALDLVIASAQDELLIFDQDFARGDFASLQRFELLQDFLSKNSLSKLTIILQDTEYFIQHCPRLFDLLKHYGHKMQVFATNDNAKIAKDCFIIADKKNYLRRFNIEQARFKYALDDVEECANLCRRFDELMDETTDAVSSTKLGL
jgi:hypothetical protein